MTMYIHSPPMRSLMNYSNHSLSYGISMDPLRKLDVVSPRYQQQERTANDNSCMNDFIFKFSALNKEFIDLDKHHDRSLILYHQKRRRNIRMRKSNTSSDTATAIMTAESVDVISGSSNSHDIDVDKTTSQPIRKRLSVLRRPSKKELNFMLRHHQDDHLKRINNDEQEYENKNRFVNIIGMEILIWNNNSGATDQTLECILQDDNSSIVSSLTFELGNKFIQI